MRFVGFYLGFYLCLCTECPITNKYLLSAGNLSMWKSNINYHKLGIVKSSLRLLHCSIKVKCQSKKRTGKLMQPSIHQQAVKQFRKERRQQRTAQFVKAPSLHFKIWPGIAELNTPVPSQASWLGPRKVRYGLQSSSGIWKRFISISVQAPVIDNVYWW